MRILIIDDNPTIREALRRTLEYDGNEVVDASNGQDGLALVGRETLDLVLLDVEMPGMGGIEVLRCLHRTRESLPVLMMSAHRPAAIVIEAMRAGAIAFLEKPFEDTDRLCTTIHHVVEQARRDERPSVSVGRRS